MTWKSAKIIQKTEWWKSPKAEQQKRKSASNENSLKVL